MPLKSTGIVKTTVLFSKSPSSRPIVLKVVIKSPPFTSILLMVSGRPGTMGMSAGAFLSQSRCMSTKQPEQFKFKCLAYWLKVDIITLTDTLGSLQPMIRWGMTLLPRG